MDTEASLMLFSVREFVFAIEIGNLLEVTLVAPDKVLPDNEGCFKAVFDYRGIRVPVIQLAADTNPFPISDSLQLLIVDGQRPLAILIDRVMEVVTGKGDVYRFPDMLRTEKNRFIKAIHRFKDGMTFVIDPALILNDYEISALRAL